jgi:hypothetical protein
MGAAPVSQQKGSALQLAKVLGEVSAED